MALVVVAVLAMLGGGCGMVPKQARPSPRPVPANVIVTLTDDISAGQKRAVGKVLSATAGVSTVRYVSRPEAYREFKKAFKNRPDLLKVTRPADLPESYRVSLADGSAIRTVIAKVRDLPGVKEARPGP
jgi:cell division transport system permease protein